MLSTVQQGLFEPHTDGAFAAFLRDNIKRVIIIGTILPQGGISQKLPVPFNKSETHTVFELCVGEHVVRFNLVDMFEGGDLRRWHRLD